MKASGRRRGSLNHGLHAIDGVAVWVLYHPIQSSRPCRRREMRLCGEFSLICAQVASEEGSVKTAERMVEAMKSEIAKKHQAEEGAGLCVNQPVRRVHPTILH